MTNGIRVSKPGYSVENANPTQLVYSSEYATLRVEIQGYGTLTSPSRSITIPHDLGYVPMFSVTGDFFGNGRYANFPFYYDQSDLFSSYPEVYALAYADSTNLYIKLSDTFGYKYAFVENGYDRAEQVVGGSTDVYYSIAALGKDTGLTLNGALRFEGLQVAQGTTVASASAFVKVTNRGGSGDIRGRFRGIKQANTGEFNSGDDPFNRTETTAEVTKTIGSGVGTGSYDEWSITSIVNEIVGQASWASGNNLGIKAWDNTSDANNFISFSNSDTYLRVLPSTTLLNYRFTIYKDKII